MNKTELIDAIATDCEISKAAAQRALESVVDNVIKAVTKGNTVQLIGFGSFSSGKRAARTGRNPRTGDRAKRASRTGPLFYDRRIVGGRRRHLARYRDDTCLHPAPLGWCPAHGQRYPSCR